MRKEDRIRTILEFLEDRNVALPPKPLYDNLDRYEGVDFSYSTVKRLLAELTEEGLVEYLDIGKGYYCISEEGSQFLGSGEQENSESTPNPWRGTLNETREEVESAFDEVSPRVSLFDSDRLGLWISFGRKGPHEEIEQLNEELSEFLRSRGYNVRSVYHEKRKPDDDRHYDGHLYALPAEVGIPDYPRDEVSAFKISNEKIEVLADRRLKKNIEDASDESENEGA